jgi:hypothetical protein
MDGANKAFWPIINAECTARVMDLLPEDISKM